ncbi:MAG: DUF1993 domain-containing protein [Deltaproteobacteria bacterium]|nr:DUF1993 domain-containing protein [Deltaproteobacteria bacterium]
MNLYDATVPIFSKFLGNIDRWLDKAAAHAKARKFDIDLLCEARLALDQFAFPRQIQSACDTAKYAVAKLTGKTPPSHPDTEQTIEELRARLRTVIDYLATFTREDFVGAEERACQHSWMQGNTMRGGDYLDHYVLPNFHFHVTTAYAILRHNGVDIGKIDFLGSLPFVKK